jgi:hypothetical protein
MSTWGLKYKGVEVLTPEEWNKVVDALNELDTRAFKKLQGGIATFSGDGSTRDFNISHNFGEAPDIALVFPASPDAVGSMWGEVATDKFTIHYTSPPPSGTDNVKLFYLIAKLTT